MSQVFTIPEIILALLVLAVIVLVLYLVYVSIKDAIEDNRRDNFHRWYTEIKGIEASREYNKKIFGDK